MTTITTTIITTTTTTTTNTNSLFSDFITPALLSKNTSEQAVEKLLLPFMTSLADCDNYQLGFKAGHSMTLCAGVFRHTVDYFVTRGSHVFVSFVDFSKAFDYVNY